MGHYLNTLSLESERWERTCHCKTIDDAVSMCVLVLALPWFVTLGVTELLGASVFLL